MRKSGEYRALLIDMVPKGETWTWAARPRENEIPMKYILDVDSRIAWRCSDPLAILNIVRSLRGAGVISPHVSCQLDNLTVYIGQSRTQFTIVD